MERKRKSEQGTNEQNKQEEQLKEAMDKLLPYMGIEDSKRYDRYIGKPIEVLQYCNSDKTISSIGICTAISAGEVHMDLLYMQINESKTLEFNLEPIMISDFKHIIVTKSAHELATNRLQELRDAEASKNNE